MHRRFVLSYTVFVIGSVVLLTLFVLDVAPAPLYGILLNSSVDSRRAESYVLGPPTESFRGNLRNDTKYITSWLNAGWTNSVMTIGNLLYLALITERVPILPRFLPSHGDRGKALPIPFSHVFNVSRLSEDLRIPILEWDQVKDVNSDTLDELGCWADYEWNRDYSPVWRFVGRHIHWNTTLEKLAEEHARRAMGVPDSEPTPAYITVHVRHDDFGVHCHDVPLGECWAPLSVFARRVAEVQQEVLDKKGIRATHVIMTSDERDPSWWAEVGELGWTWVDYAAEGTTEKYGRWYPLLIDAVLQSSGVGFVGTDHSTMSLVALRRMQDWQDGAARLTKFGWPGADDH
ncbi:hypothetical protein ID866_4554 [Astraeus odoratus]|nr:hypothetical protein ID866_4554 [Astraeus odoratus]